MKINAGILLLLGLCLSGVTGQDDVVKVKTASGEILGKRTKVNEDKYVDAFLGIPYAEPPVGKLRFKKPRPLENIPSTTEAFKLSASCHQIRLVLMDYIGDIPLGVKEEEKEDCLCLNIWKPVSNTPTGEDKPKAVMVWIHGGAFVAGSSGSPLYNGQSLSSFGDVIIVSMNYRLGSFGFLSAGTEEEPGNLGLYDQNLALKWVKENIKYFGGNPSEVTIFGESAGGMSVSYHVTSPLAQGLFKRAIIESGTSNLNLITRSKERILNVTNELSHKVNCQKEGFSIHKNPQEVLECLRSKTPEELAHAEYLIMKERDYPVQFTPIYDEDYVSYKSAVPFRPNFNNDVDIIIGANKNEMGGLIGLFFPKLYQKNATQNGKKEMINIVRDFITENQPLENIDKIIDPYFEDVPEDNYTAIAMAVDRILTDYFFLCPSLYYSSLHALQSNGVYFYFFTHHSSFNLGSPLSYGKYPGAFHGDELFFIFDLLINNVPAFNMTQEEILFSKNIKELWTSFSKTGTPKSSSYPHWPFFTTTDPRILELNAEGPSFSSLPSYDLCQGIWKKYYFEST